MARNAPWNWNERVVGPDYKATPEFLAWLQQQLQVNEVAGTAVLQNRRVDTGTGLTGGGDLSADRTISLDAIIDDLNDVDTATNPPTDGQALTWDSVDELWVPDDVYPGLDVKDEGSLEVSPATILNFIGSSVVVTDAGGGQANITISGGGGGGSGIVASVKVDFDTAGVMTLVGANNVSGVTRLSTGKYEISFTSAIPSGCAMLGSGRFGDNSSDEGVLLTPSRVSGEGIGTTTAQVFVHAAVLGGVYDPYDAGRANSWFFIQIIDATAI